MEQVLGKLAGREVVAEFPAVTAENEECTDGGLPSPRRLLTLNRVARTTRMCCW